MAKNKNKAVRFTVVFLAVLVLAAAAVFGYGYISRDISGERNRKSESVIEIGDNANLYDISQKLLTSEIINSDTVWDYWMRKHYPDIEIVAGEYQLNSSMSYEDIAGALQNPVVTKRKITVSIPEGYDVFKIAEVLEENGICPADDFLAVCRDKNGYDYSFIADIPDSDTIAYPLEGFLFPATYEFKENSDAVDIADQMLSAFADRITDEWRQFAQNNGMTMYELVTLASVVEKETLGEGVAEKISSVFINRLQKGQQLQSDVTIDYGNKLRAAGFDDKTVTSYNTYKCAALPSGPICNPGVANIDAVVNHENTDYFYFFSYNNGADFYFTDSYEDFQKQWAKLGSTNTN